LEQLANGARSRPAAATEPMESPGWRQALLPALVHPLNIVVPLALLAVGLAIDVLWIVAVAAAAYAALVAVSLVERKRRRTAGAGEG
jgi:hypothetical protein